jgi:phosphoglycolate phosphatase-like HAD superfamily hydrolase
MKLFVWDFHGVLEKDNEKAVIDISNQVLAQAGYKERFTDEDNERLYGLKWHQYFEDLLPGLSKEEHLSLQAACFKFAEDNLHILEKHIKPNDYAAAVLARLAKAGHQNITISNTRQSDLVWFLNTVNLRRFFNDEHIIGVNAHQTHQTKLDALQAYLKGKKFDKIIAIGDAEADLELGKAVGAVTYFYKHPHRKHETTKNADHIINDLRKLLAEV